MVRGKRRPREVIKLADPGFIALVAPRRSPESPALMPYRFRSGPQTTPLARRASISPLEYPNSVSTSVACWLNFGGALRRLGLLRSRRIGEATPLYQSISMM